MVVGIMQVNVEIVVVSLIVCQQVNINAVLVLYVVAVYRKICTGMESLSFTKGAFHIN